MSTSTVDQIGVPVSTEQKTKDASGLFVEALKKVPNRFFKISGGSLVLFAGVYAVTSQQQYISSNNAVVSAQVISLNVPIEGYVSGMQVHLSDRIQKGQILGRVTNSRVDDSSALGFAERGAESEANVKGALLAREELIRERQHLQDRTLEHDAIAGKRIRGLVDQAQRLYDAKIAYREESSRKLARTRQLFDSGIVSRNDFEVVESQYEVAAKEAEAQKSALAALKAEEEAAGKGFSAQMSETDVPYSRQRIDEINIRIADLDRVIAVHSAQASSSEALSQAEREHFNLLRSSDLVAPVSGMLWKIGTSEGERVGAGDMVAQFVDCNSSFLVVAIPQSRVPDVKVGGTAQFRLAGESKDRTGIVTSVDGDTNVNAQGKLAILPASAPGKSGNALVRVALQASNSPSGECIVGRSARVILPSNGRGVLARSVSSLR